jgi:hypothetical protein
MQQKEFSSSKHHTELVDKSVTLLHLKKYSPLLFYKILKNFEKEFRLGLKKIDLDQDLAIIQKDLQTTFLGQTFLYWFSDITLINSKKKKSDFISFVCSYQGPHKIIGCIDDQETITVSEGLIMEFEENYTADQAIKLHFLYDGQKPEVISYFLGKLYRYLKQYTIDQLCVLLEYSTLLGKNMDQFFQEWLDEIVMSDVSLYAVSQYFFEKNPKKFFELFNQLRHIYSEPFWTTFFSEQLFKAYWYVVNKGQIAPEQKQMTFGLPFSFMKLDWKHHKKESLQQAHQKIYEVDLAVKSSNSAMELDLFCMQFFQGF